MPGTICVGMSGGVDSSVAALLLREEGCRVIGATLLLKPDGGETAREELADAERVARALGIAHRVVDLRERFRETVIAYFAEEYLSGATPNPCVRCNPEMKFAALLEIAREEGADGIATGHYARVEQAGGRFLLKKSSSAKDQSYFLHGLRQEQLARTRFPLGQLEKAEIRALAERYDLPVAQKRDSQEICFVAEGAYASFLCGLGLPLPGPGKFIGTDGEVLGEHRGILHYTVGQRKGLGAFGKPMYVTAIDEAANTVTLGEEEKLYARGCVVEGLNWSAFEKLEQPRRAEVKVRHQAEAVSAQLTPEAEARVRVVFDTPVRAATPGQFAVFYEGDTVLGGGRITRAAGV